MPDWDQTMLDLVRPDQTCKDWIHWIGRTRFVRTGSEQIRQHYTRTHQTRQYKA